MQFSVRDQQLLNRGIEAKHNLEEANKDLDSTVEQLLIKNAELEAYAHTIAHSLKTPLAASIRFLDILSNLNEDSLSKKQHRLAMQALRLCASEWTWPLMRRSIIWKRQIKASIPRLSN